MAIVINNTTGEIDLDQTTPGTYVVTYTVQGVSSTQEVTVNAADNAGFSYSASSYEPTDPDPTPTITGLTGGTFSAGSGLVFVDSGTNTGSSTGEIDLSASTATSYTITYDTTSSGSSVCPNTSTQTVEIAVAGIANNYSMNFDSASSDYISIGTISSLNAQQNFSISLWFKENVRRTNGFMFSSGTGASNDIAINAANGTLKINVGGTRNVNITSYSSNVWYHVVLTVENTTARVYLNNGSPTTVTVGSNTSSSSGTLAKIGDLSFASGYYFDGIIDEVGIWNTALTSTQVAEIYNGTGTNTTKDLTTVSGSNLVYWNRMGD